MSALRALVEGAGAAPGLEVVTYCSTGMLSSVGYFVARYLGYNATLYDGSYADWKQRPHLPITAGATP